MAVQVNRQKKKTFSFVLLHDFTQVHTSIKVFIAIDAFLAHSDHLFSPNVYLFICLTDLEKIPHWILCKKGQLLGSWCHFTTAMMYLDLSFLFCNAILQAADPSFGIHFIIHTDV